MSGAFPPSAMRDAAALADAKPDLVLAYLASRWWSPREDLGEALLYARPAPGGGESVVRVAMAETASGYHRLVADTVADIARAEDRWPGEVLRDVLGYAESPGRPWGDEVSRLAASFSEAADRIASRDVLAGFGGRAVVGLAMRPRPIPGYDRSHDALGQTFVRRLGFKIVGGNGIPTSRVHYVAVDVDGLRAAADLVSRMGPRGGGWRAIGEISCVVAAGRFHSRFARERGDGDGFGVQFWDIGEGSTESVARWVEHLGGTARTWPSMPRHLFAKIPAVAAPRIAEHVLVRDVSVSARIELR